MRGELRPPLADAWVEAELELPARLSSDFRNVFTGELIRLNNSRSLLCREVFAHFPVTLLISH